MYKIAKITITPVLTMILAELDAFKHEWPSLQKTHQLALQQLRYVAGIESIGSSNRIEGNRLTDKEVETIFKHIRMQSFNTRDDQEVAGYARVMTQIYDDYEVIPFTENHIKQLHQMLLEACDKDTAHCGEYKKVSNSVVAFDAQGKQIGVVFDTTSPFDTPEQMRQLVAHTRGLLQDKAHHPLILIAAFIVHFLAIHPFQDGNGRLSRLLTTLLLLQQGYDYTPFSSLESVIEAHKSAYYKALRDTQLTLGSDTPDYRPWLHFFMRSLQKQVLHLKRKIKLLSVPALPCPHRPSLDRLSERILQELQLAESLTTAEIATRLQAKPDTVRKALARLSKTQLITKHGSTKGAFYRCTSE